jgi:dUTP pyrophosphatase
MLPITVPSEGPTPMEHKSITHSLPDVSGQSKMKAVVRNMQKAWTNVHSHLSPPSVKVHIDGGANRSVTNLCNSLVSYKNIKKYPMSGVAAGNAALMCTGIGYLPWTADNGDMLLVKCYYSADAADTIISPTDIVINSLSDYEAWEQYSNIDTATGYIKFHRRDRQSSLTYSLHMINGLWFHTNKHDIVDYHTWMTRSLDGQPIIRRLNRAAEYQLAHLRYGCAGQRNLSIVHLHIDNQPKLQKHAFFNCLTCMLATGDCRNTTGDTDTGPTAVFDDWFNDTPETLSEACLPGQHFHVDFGFMKGSGYCKQDEEGRTITSIDGFRSYFLIIDRKTRYVWVFLTKTKQPPLTIFAQFLKEHGHPSAQNRTVRSDRGGELWGSQSFRDTVQAAGFIMDPTAPQAAFQNGTAERPNRNFGKTVRCLLYNANLGPEYWSYALMHAVYLKNRLPHCTTNQVPLTAYTGRRPNAKRLRVFGCPIVVRHQDRKAKLDLNTSAGIFLGYTATDRNIVYRDSVTGRFKTATHVVFDEAGMTLPANERSPSAKLLQDLGYSRDVETEAPLEATGLDEAAADATIQYQSPSPQAEHTLKVQFLSVHATMPVRATDGSAGYDVFSAEDVILQPNTRRAIPLDIAITPPPGTYAQIHSRSGMSAKHRIDVRAGTIDRDYTGNVKVLLENTGETPYSIKIGDRIAQLILVNIQTPPVQQTANLDDTARGSGGFGSTGTTTIERAQPMNQLHNALLPSSTTGSSEPTVQNLTAPKQDDTQSVEVDHSPTNTPSTGQPTVGEKPYDIYFCHDPFDNTVEVDIPIKGDHPTLGILTQYCDFRQRLQVTDMALSTPGSRIKSWRTVMRKSYILKFNDFVIQSLQDLEHAIKQTRLRKMLKAKMVIATDKSYGVHPIEGILQIHFDQLNTIAKHLEEIKRDQDATKMAALPHPTEATVRVQTANSSTDHAIETPPEKQTPTEKPPPLPPEEELAQSFTKKQLLKRDDWPDWQRGIYKQLNQYWNQGMFSTPMPLPINANALHMLWRYNLKACGTKKCRMVCNGSPGQKGTVTLGHTYANALDAASERLFWAIVASENLIAIGADVSNAFAEAPAPKAPLYLYIDDAFREWWVNHLGKEPIPSDCTVVRVHNAIQGHPESPRLWEKHIDGILKALGLTPATHEPCLYSGFYTGERVLFLRQVDDFAVASTNKSTAESLITAINDQMRIEVKHLGILDRFNGLDILQSRHFVKITCEKYLKKMVKGHHDILKDKNIPQNPVPLPADSNYIRNLETAKVPTTLPEKLKLKERMGVNYRQIIGEIIFPMMKCRPEIAPHAIKLSQYMENPAEAHYQALLDILGFLANTIDDGIYYWRTSPRMDLPPHPLPSLHPDNYMMQDNTPNNKDLYGYVDSDWGSDSNHRKSITGIVIMYAGGAVGYKCKYQDVIAHSSTEAEFTAACDAGKMILFFRSILADLGIEQEKATVLFEDNNGALLMANAQQPTRRTRHMDIKKFALLDWVEQDLMILQSICTAENAADGLTKPLAKQLFYRHADTVLGKRVPDYVLRTISQIPP